MSAIGYKSHRVLVGMFSKPWHPKILELFLWLTVRYSHITLTSAYRKKLIYTSDSGIHMTDPLRAIDLRSRNFDDPLKVEHDINQHFIYDPVRPWLKVCVYKNTGFGWHFHLQVHDRSFLKGHL